MQQIWPSFEQLFTHGFGSFLITVFLLCIICSIVIKLVGMLFKAAIRRSGNKESSTNLILLRRVVKGVIIILAVCLIMMQIAPLRSVVVSLLASSGVLAVVLGFAAQEAMANLVSGAFIYLFKPFSIGDRIVIQTEAIEGIVEDISLRHTVIRTFTNSRIIVPNSKINAAVLENRYYKDSVTCNYLDISAGYDADLDRMIAIIQEEAAAHPDFCDNRSAEAKEAGQPAVPVRVIEFAESSITLRAYLWSKTPESGFGMLCDLRLSLKKRFDREHISLPYPHLEVIQKQDTNLGGTLHEGQTEKDS